MTPLVELVDARTYACGETAEGCSLAITPGEMVGLVGRNGAGKTVTLKVICGLAPLFSGRVMFEGRDVSRLPAQRRAAAGMAFVPHERRVFGGLSVEQNLRLGAYVLRKRQPWRFDEVLAGVLQRFPLLVDCLKRPADELPAGYQTMLAFARALMSAPKLVLLDEPLAHLAASIADELAATLRDLNGSGVTLLFAEQNLEMAQRIAERLLVIEKGCVVSQVAAAPR